MIDRDFDVSAYEQGVRDGRHEAQAEIDSLRQELDANCPVEAVERGMSPVEAAIYHVWGERCSDFEPGCPCCRAWAEHDQITKLRVALTQIRDAGPMTLDDQRWRIALAALEVRND